MLDYIQREGFTEKLLSAHPDDRLTALAAAKMLNLQTSGIITDFPQYIRILTDDSFLESVAGITCIGSTASSIAFSSTRKNIGEAGLPADLRRKN